MLDFLIEYGYIGVFLAAFLAATVLPFWLRASGDRSACHRAGVCAGTRCSDYWQLLRWHELLLDRLARQDRVDSQVPQDARGEGR